MRRTREPEPSPMKNVTGGSGCGCGCLGMLIALVGTVALVGIPLELYSVEDNNSFFWIGMSGFGCGGSMFFVGVVAYIGSLFLE